MALDNAASPTRPFKIVDVPGKGKGVVSTRAIQAGELVLAEKPLFTAGLVCPEASIAAKVAQLSSVDQPAFYSLSIAPPMTCYGPHRARFDTNALPLGEEAAEAGLFPVGAPSCRPNVSRFWEEAAGEEWFVASVDIPPSTELTIYYNALDSPRAERQAYLLRTLGFKCTCERCDLALDEVEKSDQRMRFYAQIEALIPTLFAEPHKLVTLAKAGLNLLAEEGLHTGAAALAYDAFQGAAFAGDKEGAKAWATRACELKVRETGREAESSKRMESLAADPMRYNAWGFLGVKRQVPRP
ncbi:SET domain-containing protein [Rhodotorula paludigena]|uniref:SET domain-containing protein n=1 Tax=Rhodotorula paludigena TaxID=86838 RepID=UPI00316EF28F